MLHTRSIRSSWNRWGYVYIAPWIIGFLVFELYPFFASLFYSFTDYSLGSHFNVIGLRNYVEMFTTDVDFGGSLRVTLLYVLMSVPLKLAFALLVALILNVRVRGIDGFRTIFYLPSILGGSVAVSLLWRFAFGHSGLVNSVLALVRIQPINWLSAPGIALFTLGLLSVWQFGSSMVIFLAGLKQIPAELYEAAKVDGAPGIRVFFRITVPLITPLILFNLILQMINAFQEFTSAFIITNGGPVKSTYLYGMMLYRQGFFYFKMGYASALSWILFVIILAFTALIFKSSDYWAFYSDGGKSL